MSQLMAKSVGADKQCFRRMTAIINHMFVRRSGHGVEYKDPHPEWKSWRDIPDSMIPTTSRRDPDNPIYATQRYVNNRKIQIWTQHTERKGIPIWLAFGAIDRITYLFAVIGVIGSLVINFYYLSLIIFFPDKLKKKK